MNFFKRFFSRKQFSGILNLGNFGDGFSRLFGLNSNYYTLVNRGYFDSTVIYSVINRISSAVSCLEFKIIDNNTGEENTVKEIIELFNQPNPYQSYDNFIKPILTDLLLTGEFFIKRVNNFPEMIKVNNKRVLSMQRVRPDIIEVDGMSTDDLPKNYKITSYESTSQRIFEVNQMSGDSDIIHGKLFNPLHNLRGLSPLVSAALPVDITTSVHRWNLSLIKNSGKTSGVISISPKSVVDSLTPEQRANIEETIKNKFSGEKNAGLPILLDGQLDFKQIGLTPSDLDFISGFNLSKREICQVYGVPPQILGVQGDSTFRNYEEARLSFYENTIIPLAENVLNTILVGLDLIDNKMHKVIIDTSKIPVFTKRRTENLISLENVSFVSVNEKRNIVGLGSIDDEKADKIPAIEYMEGMTQVDNLDEDDEDEDEDESESEDGEEEE